MVIKEVFHMVSKRDENSCNFLEGSRLGGSGAGCHHPLSLSAVSWGEGTGG